MLSVSLRAPTFYLTVLCIFVCWIPTAFAQEAEEAILSIDPKLRYILKIDRVTIEPTRGELPSATTTISCFGTEEASALVWLERGGKRYSEQTLMWDGAQERYAGTMSFAPDFTAGDYQVRCELQRNGSTSEVATAEQTLRLDPEPTEACCIDDGTCRDATLAVCHDLSGRPRGRGTACRPNLCPDLTVPDDVGSAPVDPVVDRPVANIGRTTVEPVFGTLEQLVRLAKDSTIYFPFDYPRPDDEVWVHREADERLKMLAEGLVAHADRIEKIVITGHCDKRGEPDYNIELGQRRAEAVERMLKANMRRIDVGIQTISEGEETPNPKCDTEHCYAQNRWAKIELRIR